MTAVLAPPPATGEAAAVPYMVLETDRLRAAVPVARVLEVVPAAPATPLPFVPGYVDGVVAVGGRIVPQIDLMRRLGLPDAGGTSGGELVLLEGAGGPYALKVRRALTIVTVPARDFSPLAGVEAAMQPYVTGEFESRGQPVLALDIDALGLEDVLLGDAPEQGPGSLRSRARAPDEERVVERFAGIVTAVGGDRYALPFEIVSEVAELDDIHPLPHAPSPMLGLFALRGRSTALFCLARLLGREPQEPPRKVVLVDGPDGKVGLAVPSLLGLQRFTDAPRRARAEMGPWVDRFLVDAGRSGDDAIVMILDLRALLMQPAVEPCRALIPRGPERTEAAEREETRRYLAVLVGGEPWGIDLDRVERVTEYRVPQDAPRHDRSGQIHGVVDIGGEILPVIDLGRLLGREEGERGAYVVARVGEGAAALVVDRLRRIVELPVRGIQPMTDPDGHLLGGVARLDGAVLSILSLDGLLAR